MIGLRNYSNNCFINAVVQALRCYNPVLDTLLRVHPDDPFTRTLCDLFFQGGDTLYPSFLKQLPSVGVDPYHQGDAHEFLLKMIDKLEDHLEFGTSTSTLACSCGHVLTNVEKLTCLSINGDIVEGIDQYLAPEQVDARCEQFGGTGMTKKMQLAPSDILIIHTKRFTLGNKLHYDVNLSPIVCGDSRWKITAVCNHYGNYDGGHYTTCALTSSGWYMCNDESVHKVDNLPKSSPLPYILFYERYGDTVRTR